MAHLNQLGEKPYQELLQRLNQYQVGAPDSEQLRKILEILYTKEEAYVGSRFPLGRASLEELSQRTGIEKSRLEQILEQMAQKGVVIDSAPGDTRLFLLSPTIFGFFEFSFMRLDSELPLKELAELMEAALQKEMGREFFGSRTQMSRTLIYEKNIPTPQVMSYEQVSEIIRRAKHLSVQPCFCRHKAQHLGRPCRSGAPLEICMGLDVSAEYLVRRGFARRASERQMLELLDRSEELGLVHTTDNVREEPLFICHCCKCCCELLRGVNQFGINHAVAPTRFIARVEERLCSGCGACLRRCQVGAISLQGRDCEKIARVDEQRCLGCSVCLAGCPTKALQMATRPKVIPVPKSHMVRYLKIAREKGRLKPFVFYAAGKILRGELSEGDLKNWETKQSNPDSD